MAHALKLTAMTKEFTLPLLSATLYASCVVGKYSDEETRVAGGSRVPLVDSGRGDTVIKRRKSLVMSAPARTAPLLVCSIGNPGPTYAHTLHSAGHTLVTRLAAHLGCPPFTKDRSLANGLVSRPVLAGTDGGGDWTLWQSPSYMNESGKGVKAAFHAWSRGLSGGQQGRLVVIYDELEQPLGKVTVRTATGLSARGHNGLKSIMAAMPQAPFARIGLGIGRPVSRDSDAVARYVLGKMRPGERERIEGSVGEVVTRLRQLEKA
ncbi:Peptidyl-tRNA hydrolase [Teratosphaeria destructans]|uniref:peptidyl-tRNA hydrolase n=1 Tax=Teratosphaeria destructans TaxID=418781 RepID=A0A9W7SRT1_9PEZI|nr:Peptidyl-tRNA hydrolase [Teratosphaeria destructans]